MSNSLEAMAKPSFVQTHRRQEDMPILPDRTTSEVQKSGAKHEASSIYDTATASYV